MAKLKTLEHLRAEKERAETQLAQEKHKLERLENRKKYLGTVRKQIGKTTYIVRVHFSETAKETMEDKIKRLLREEVRKM